MKTKPTKPTECERCIEAYKKGLLILIEKELRQTIKSDLDMSDEYILTLEVFKRLKQHITKTLR